MDSETHSVYRIGEFRFAPQDHRLSHDGEEVHLRPKTFQIFQYLVEHHGHLVTREELLDAVWPETYVDEKVLSRSVWEIREALKRNGEDSQLIQTVPKVGYQFVGTVRAVDARESEPGPRERRPAKSLAAGLVLIVCAASLAWWLARPGPQDRILQAVPLTTDPGMENWPTFSPDGEQVAFQGDVEGKRGTIFVKQIGEDASLRRTFGPGLDHAASWSPDGRWIAFLRGEAPSGPLTLMVVSPVAGAERVITHIKAPVSWSFRPAWTPDSQALIVPDREGAPLTYALYRVSIDDGERTQLTVPNESSPGEGDKDPAVSPDGTRLAFTRNGDLQLLALDGQYPPSGHPRTLASAGEPGGLWGLAWTADSREIVFAAGNWPRARLFRVSAAGGEVRELTSLGAGTFAPALSTTGNRLAYLEWITSADIWQIRLGNEGQATAEPTRLVSSSRLDGYPVHSPDGERIAFHSDRTGRDELWIVSASGGSASLLEPLRQGEGALAPEPGFSWSPDQSSMVFAADGDLFVVDVFSGKCRSLTMDSTVDESPVWSPDGRWVYFSSRRDGVWQVSRVLAAGGQPVQLMRDGGRLLAVSPDGRQIYYVQDKKLWTIPCGGGDPIEILDLAPDYAVVTERGIYCALNGPTHRIQYFDLDSGSATVVAEIDAWIMGFSVSPDRSHLVYGLIDHKRADLMLVENFE